MRRRCNASHPRLRRLDRLMGGDQGRAQASTCLVATCSGVGLERTSGRGAGGRGSVPRSVGSHDSD